MLIAHGPLALLTTKALFRKEIEKVNKDKQVIIYILAILFGILPDFDFFILIALSLPPFLHHDIITHTPIFWISLYTAGKLLYPTVLRKKNEYFELILKVFLVSTLSHMVGDIFMGHISLLWPVWDRGFSLLAHVIPSNTFAGYETHPVFILEVYIITIFIIWLFGQIRKVKTDSLYKISSLIFFLLIIFSSYMYTQVYQNYKFQLNDREMPIYDTDNDTLIDALDYDVGNTGSNNILSAQIEDILKGVDNIKNSGKKVVPFRNRTHSENIYRHFGAMDSTRYILQVYLEANKPIVPVLTQENQKIVDLPSELRMYLKDSNLLSSSPIDQIFNIEPGKILFILDSTEKIVNLGIADRNGDILIVLDNSVTRTFSLTDVVKHYSDKEYTIEYQN